MDLHTIIILIAEFLLGGGIIAIVTIKDKKTAAILDNMQKVIEEERALAQEYKEEAESLREECRKKDDIIRGKEDYIRDLHKDKSELHDKLDKANSRAAVNKLLKCQEIGCAQRRPPLGEGAADTFKQIRNGNLGDEENGEGNI
jgi:septal ring factor EnvC (AmiA/AmiB activator)